MSSDPGQFKIPFGKHRGEPIDAAPLKYLDWMVGLLDDEESAIHNYPDFAVSLQEYMNLDSVKRAIENESSDW